MSNRMWERLGAATGIVSVVLFAVGFSQGPESPELEKATAQQMRSFLAENSSRLRMLTLLMVLASFFLLWFLGSLRTALLGAEGVPGRLTSIAFGAGVLNVALYLATFGITGQGLFADAGELDPNVARDIFVVGETGFGPLGVATIARAAMVGAASLVALRFGGLPRWLGWIGAVVAAASFLGTFTIVESSPGEGPLGGVWFFSWLAFTLWVLLTSIVLTLRTGAEAPIVEASQR